MRQIRWFAPLSVMLSCAAFAFGPGDFQPLSGTASPAVSWAVAKTDAGLSVEVRVAPFLPGLPPPRVELAAAAVHRHLVAKEGGTAVFDLPAEQLVEKADDWKKLRLAVRVSWPDARDGFAQRERFRCLDARAVHAPLPDDPLLWAPLDLDEHARSVADGKDAITIAFQQPMDGKATIVVEDADGNRVRNLVSGATFSRGAHAVAWDGLDETGRPVPPGSYRWRSISHPGIEPRHLFSFCDGPGSNHGTLQAAATDGELVFVGTPVSEGGKEITALRPDGTVVGAWVAPHGHGLGAIALAAGDGFLYGAYDGTSWGQKVDRSTPGWKAEQAIGLVRIDLARGDFADWGRQRILPVVKYVVGPGAEPPAPNRLSLAGLAYLDGKLYLASGFDAAILVLDPADGHETGRIPLVAPAALAATPDGKLLAASDGAVVRIDPATGASETIVAAGLLQPSGLAAAPDGRIFVSDAATHSVKVLPAGDSDPARPRFTTIGSQPGGPYQGAYDPDRLINPRGLAFAPDGRLWITEAGRWTPKRLAIFDPDAGALSEAFFGPTAYGAPGGGFDPLDHERWIAQGTLFDVDFATGKAEPRFVLGGKDGSHYRFWRQDGRTFVISYGKATFLQELRDDGTLKPFACLSSAHQFAYYHQWNPPQPFIEAFERAYPEAGPVKRGSPRKPNHGFGMVWVDRNGDGEFQADEFEFATSAQNMAGSGWGHDLADLTIRVGAIVDGRDVLVTLSPRGYDANGVPDYPRLADALADAVPLSRGAHCSSDTTVDRFGNVVFNASPMCSFAPDGRCLWTYPNQWIGVHGSHKAPLPRPGQLQGVLFFTGVAPLDDVSDVMVMNGNHGRFFVMTGDGLFLDEMFHDVRVSSIRDVYMVGGECFGGTFGRSGKDGNYYLQAGGIEYRVFRLDGLRETKRQEGAVEVAPGQVAAAERALAARQAEVQAATPAEAKVPRRDVPPAIDGRSNDWPATDTLSWSRDKRFAVSVNLAYDATHLHLCYRLKDDSPWVNNGGDWQALFKTGDAIDLQLGTDATANPQRSGPVPGDLRLLIAPQGDANRVVLYRHRLPDGPGEDAVTFQSPWRSERVDSVRELPDARVAVSRGRDSVVVEASVPLADLGLQPRPGLQVKADCGVIHGDADGTINLFRDYWSNPATMLVNDVPGEIMLTPRLWGTLSFE
ncbi:MAG: FlgD immunoglobulin-like domain containing protein [Kiritimatiellia bacterium]